VERVTLRLQTALAALQTLLDALDALEAPAREPDGSTPLDKLRQKALERDAVILRFQYTFETVWKAAKAYLSAIEGVDAASPKAVIRHCRLAGVLDEQDAGLALRMADARNLTAHTYNEVLACEIQANARPFASLMDRWIAAMQKGRRALDT
jgi:nucleotidyltransferase substrate binding protein (TIGR01987 family)